MAPPPGDALPQQRLYELAVRYGELDVANEILNRGKLKEPQAAPERQPLLHVLRAARALRSKPKQRRKQPRIWLLKADEISKLPVPWPRQQDASAAITADEPFAEDLIVCVSHGWPFQVHPDPHGEKIAHIEELLSQATDLCVSQRPRAPQEEEVFQRALSAMPQLYLKADVVLHVDSQGHAQLAGEGEEVSATLGELRGAELLGVGGCVQVLHSADEARVPRFSVVVRVGNGGAVRSVGEVEAAQATLAADTLVTLRRAPFGLRNETACDARGWVYLERFCSMVKVALCTDDAEATRVAYSNSAAALRQIHEGGRRLRAAAMEGEATLAAVLQEFDAELHTKRFGGASIDALAGSVSRTHGAAVGAQTPAAHAAGAAPAVAPAAAAPAAPAAPELMGDALVVARLMRQLAAELPSHWEQEKSAQRQRALVLAVHRGDALAVAALLRAGADVNAADSRGTTVLHTAVVHRDLPTARALLAGGARPTLADEEGNLPSHLVQLWAVEETVELFLLLVADGASQLDIQSWVAGAGHTDMPPPQLDMQSWVECSTDGAALYARNRAGVTPFDRFQIWAATAADGKPYPPAQRAVDALLDAEPALHAARRSSAAGGGEEEGHDEAALGAVRAAREELAHAGGTLPVRTYEPPQLAECDVVVLLHHISLPFAVMEPAADRLARGIAARLRARVWLLQPAPRRADSPLAEFTADVVDAISRLPLRDEFGLVASDVTGCALWPLEAMGRLRYALVTNPFGYWAEEYIGSPGHDGFAAAMGRYEALFTSTPPEEMGAHEGLATSVNCFALGEDLAELGTLYRRAWDREHADGPDCRACMRHMACFLRWSVREMADDLRNRPQLQTPVTMLLSAFLPASRLDAAKRMHTELFLDAALEYIPRSKGWFCAPPEQRAGATQAVLDALVALHERAADPAAQAAAEPELSEIGPEATTRPTLVQLLKD